jgi:hypothetical protein
MNGFPQLLSVAYGQANLNRMLARSKCCTSSKWAAILVLVKHLPFHQVKDIAAIEPQANLILHFNLLITEVLRRCRDSIPPRLFGRLAIDTHSSAKTASLEAAGVAE